MSSDIEQTLFSILELRDKIAQEDSRILDIAGGTFQNYLNDFLCGGLLR
jgi:hypothetical protein